MKMDLGFGKNQLTVNIEEKNILGVIMPNKVEASSFDLDAVKLALEQPIASKRLKDIVHPGEKIVIITSDITRPMPSKLVLPEILKELYAGGAQAKDIIIVFSLGSHRPHTEDEKKYLVGEQIYCEIQCVDSDVSDFMSLGRTSRGTSVDIFRPVALADRIICLGNIEYHYFAGYSGGAKAIMPGVSTREAIQSNHSMMVDEHSFAGEIDRNPVRQDIEEVAKFLKIDFILNVVLDEKKNIVKAVAGDYIKAHREGCKYLDSIYKVRIREKADIVVVSAGGYPKDINMYQAQKALDNAKHAVKKGGIIIWVASCKEGFGEDVFEDWMLNSISPNHMVQRIKTKFELGGHKAAAIGLVLQNASIFLVSELPQDLIKKINFESFSNVKDAMDRAFMEVGPGAKVFLMPYGGSTLPAFNDCQLSLEVSVMDRKIAFLVSNEFEDLELWYPVLRLREEGITVHLVGDKSKEKYVGKHGYHAYSDYSFSEINISEYNAILIPGGWAPDKLRRFPEVLDYIKYMDSHKKLIGQICHGGWVLISAKILNGRKVTSTPGIRDDMENAGAIWFNEPVVVDDNIISGRLVEDLPFYMKSFLENYNKVQTY